MRKVNLRMNEQLKYEEIKKCIDGNQSKEKTSIKLGITIRQVNKLIIRYKEKGKEGFIHGNRSRKPTNYKGLSLREKIISLYETKYKLSIKNEYGEESVWNFNINHFKELLKQKEGILIFILYLKNIVFYPLKPIKKLKENLLKNKLWRKRK